MDFELLYLEEVEHELIESYCCSMNDKKLELYFKKESHEDNDMDNLTSRTHVLLDTLNNDIVGYFTLSFNMMGYDKHKKQQLDMNTLNHYNGHYPTVILNFFGINDKYKGKYIDESEVKYSKLLMFYFMSESYVVLKTVPFSVINLLSYYETQRFYQSYDFTYARKTGHEETLYQHILPANRLDDLLSIENPQSPFVELYEIMHETE